MTMAYMGDKEVKQADCVLGAEPSLAFVHCHLTQAHSCRVSGANGKALLTISASANGDAEAVCEARE